MRYGSASLPNGYIERKAGGKYEGELVIEGIDISPITGVYFIDKGKKCLWLRRKDMLVYDVQTQGYVTRKREPRWEAYLEKTSEGNMTMYKGEFCFFKFKFAITGVWDEVFGMEKNRMNFFAERLSLDKQDIINGINKRRQDE